jgi:alkylated DNA repair dioxygenase AlkB
MNNTVQELTGLAEDPDKHLCGTRAARNPAAPVRALQSLVNQAELFRSEPEVPEGFRYEPDFLSEREQAALLEQIRGEAFEPMQFHGYTAKRRTVEYGLEYDFGTRRASPTKPFPDFLLPLRERAAAFAGVTFDALVEGMIIEYPPGAPIGWHRDAPQFGIVIGISLLNAARMRLKPHNKAGEIISVTLEPRSIYVLNGSVRWQWQHSIPAQEAPRYSITFRTLRERQDRKHA